MTPYLKLQLHLERHMYKRGQFKGDAPADSSRRSKNHFRVTKRSEGLCVRMYNTDLITVTPDNRVLISMGGWWTSTTKANINDAMHNFLGWGGVGSRKVFGMTQLCMRANGKDYLLYDGMEFTYEGELLSPARFFERKQTDRAETAEFRKDIEASGFKEVWPVLFATAEPNRRWGWGAPPLIKMVTEEHHANHWADLAALKKVYFDDHKAAYQSIVRECTRDMTEVTKTNVTVL